MSKVRFLNADYDPLSLSQTVDTVFHHIETGPRGWLCTVNVAILMMMRSDPRLQGFVDRAAIVVADGQPIVWCAPWRVEITSAVKPAGNELEIDVVNLWPNRLIGDARLPKEQRRTLTNVRKFEKPGSPLLESGLLGPVTLQATAATPRER